MDDQGTWPVPLSAQDGTDARTFDRQVMDEIRSDPRALQQIGGVRGNALIVLVPLLAAVAAVVLLLQWMRTDAAVWLGVLAVVLVAALIVWISRLRAVMGQARQVLGQTVAGSVGYGIGIIRDVQIRSSPGPADPAPTASEPAAEPAPAPASAPGDDTDDDGDSPGDEEDDLSSVEAELSLAVTPSRGKPFTATTVQRYATIDALRLERGQHGPVRYMQRSPETTAAIETQLSPEAVQRLYRAAALNG